MRSFITFIIALTGITQLSAEQRSDRIVIQGNPAGNQTIQTDAAGRTHVEYSYNDRGRGDHITATWNSMLLECPLNMKVVATIT